MNTYQIQMQEFIQSWLTYGFLLSLESDMTLSMK